MNPITGFRIGLSTPQEVFFELDEYRTTLQDSWFNFMDLIEPKELNYLNIARNWKESGMGLYHSDFTINISLSNRVFVQKRVVYDMLMMFSDVGGLYDFLFLSLSSILSYFSNSLLQTSLLRNLFILRSGPKMRHSTIMYPLISALSCSLLPFRNFKSRRLTIKKGS